MAHTDRNPVTCGNCGTVNPPDQDFCIKCGEPLTDSAAEGMVEQMEAQREGGVYGVGEDDAAFEQAEIDGPSNPREPHRRSL
jgi:uncharacterized OB-fold protein